MTTPEDVRRAYDAIAAEYTDLYRHELRGRPLERALLAAFAELVGDRPVADLGCGPGRVTAHLRDLGVSAFGTTRTSGMAWTRVIRAASSSPARASMIS